MERKSRILSLLLALCITVCYGFAAGEVFAASKKPGKVKKVKLGASTYSSLTVKWSKASKAKKYQIAYKKAGAKKYKYVKTKSRSYKIKGLKAKTKYYVRVRAINGKKYGKWSATKKWKTKAAPKKTPTVDYTKAADEKKLKVSATDSTIKISISSLGKSGTGTLYSTNANTYLTGDTMRGIVSSNVKGTKIGSFALNSSKSFTISRYTTSGYDRLYDKYYIVQNGKIIKGPVYATSVTPLRNVKVKKDVPTKKGIVDENGDESFEVAEDLGCSWTAVNIDFTELVYANEDAKGNLIDNSNKNADIIEVNGETYYMNKSYVSFLDSLFSRYQKMDINVVGICISFVSTEKSHAYPRSLKYIDDARWTNGFNTSNQLGRDYFIACMEYLAKRYSKGDKGLICDYIIGNEIDYTYDWYEVVPNKNTTGKALPARGTKYLNLRPGEEEVRVSLDTFMEEYSRTLRLANLAVKKYSDDITVGISLSKEWALSRAQRDKLTKKDKRYDSYSPKEVLDWLNYYSKKSGDYDWTLTPHNYPMTNCNAAAYETALTSDTVYITGDPDTSLMISLNNLEVLQLYLDRSHNKYAGKARDVYFTENGSSSGSEPGTPPMINQKEQAAAIAQYYYRAASLPSVKAIIYYKITDREQEGATTFKLGLFDTNGAKKLSYDVWKYIDTSRSFEVSRKYLSNISFKKKGVEYSYAKGNIKSYRDLMTIVDSKFDWNKYWNEDAMTPVKLEETSDEISLLTDKEVYGADDPILVTATGAGSDTVGLYRKGDKLSDGPLYSYDIGGSENGIKRKSGGQYDIRCGALNMERYEDAKLPEGDYAVKISSGDEEMLSVDISIKGKSTFDGQKIVTTDKSSYGAGEKIAVTASGSGNDWVGIYKKGEKPSATVNSFYWYYVQDDSHIPGKPYIIQNGISNKRATELPAGEYVVILLADNGYDEITRTETIVIEERSADDISLSSVEYTPDNASDGFANGTVTITRADSSAASDCIMYWADKNGKPIDGYAHLAKFRLTGKVTEHRMAVNTIIPPGAEKLIAYGCYGAKMSEEMVSTDLPDGCSYKLESDPIISFPVFSDIHVVNDGNGNDFNENTNHHFTTALKDTVENLPDSIGVFINGDIADHGKASEFRTVYNLYRSVEDSPFIHISMGNHDWRTGNPDGQFQKYVNMFNPEVETETPYYDEWINGYHFIFLSGEAPGDNAQLSSEQLEWFEDLLEADSADDQSRPVFVFLHQGLQDSMAGNYSGQWGYYHGVNQDGQLRNIVNKHGQVVMFGGHTHYELDTENTVTAGSEEFPVYVNTAAVGYLWHCYNDPMGEYMYGAHGYFIQVFEDKIYIFGRDFLSGEFMPSAMYVIEPVSLTTSAGKIGMTVGDDPINIGAKTEEGTELIYSSSDTSVAKVDSRGNVRAVGAGKAKICVTAEGSNTKAVNRRTVTVTVSAK